MTNSTCRAADPNTCHRHGTRAKMTQAEKQNLDSFKQQLNNTFQQAEQPAEKPDNGDAFIHQEQYRNVKKMPALFIIDRTNHVCTEELNPAATWIFDEESHPTYKKDGTSITVDADGKVWARRAVKKGKTAPPHFILAETDPITGHQFGLEPIEQSGFKKMFNEAHQNMTLEPGTYELCGPKVNGNPEQLNSHTLLKHGDDTATDIPDMRNIPKEEAFSTLKSIFAGYKEKGIEGVVWWGADGKRTKLRVKDFFPEENRW